MEAAYFQLTALKIDINTQQLGLEFGTGAVIGGIIGYLTKKVAKLVAILIGLELVLFKLLESRRILEVNWDKLGASFLEVREIASGNAPPSWVMSILSTLSMGAGFAGGFLLGFKRG